MHDPRISEIQNCKKTLVVRQNKVTQKSALHRSTTTFGDFKFGLVAGDRCVFAFNRCLAVTSKHRSQQIAAFLRYS